MQGPHDAERAAWRMTWAAHTTGKVTFVLGRGVPHVSGIAPEVVSFTLSPEVNQVLV